MTYESHGVRRRGETSGVVTAFSIRSHMASQGLTGSWDYNSRTASAPEVIWTQYGFRGDGQPVMFLRQIGVQVTHAAEVVSARNATVDKAKTLDIRPPAIVLTIERTYYADARPVETADIVIPVDHYQVLYGTSIWDEPTAE
ncbi:UTRA domain-containing protein [Nonomuraea phyllanthi]|uniref:UTRA domain-containing protein n=1 Tax=Nonomuraea phyllanthi TaxID=2219224 RepID=A0A5C4WTF6_9ACTN|nr:UTRA domain-containing protein [Nonomuraea phyllanthi]KAB8196034.1 UTRA domain-containing protein [Nonomuraea phyllanthi]